VWEKETRCWLGSGDNPRTGPQLPSTTLCAGPPSKPYLSASDGPKPVIVVVIAGRPVGLGPAKDCDTVLMAYQGSTAAGTSRSPCGIS